MPDAEASDALPNLLDELHANEEAQEVPEEEDVVEEGVFEDVDAALQALPRLKELRMRGDNVGNRGAAAIADAIARGGAPRLRCLDLSYCSVGDEGVVALIAALPRAPLLQELNLEDNNDITDEGARALAAALESLPALEELYLNNGGVGYRGTAAVVFALKELGRFGRGFSFDIADMMDEMDLWEDEDYLRAVEEEAQGREPKSPQ